MSDLQKTFQALQPYLVGIRYIESLPIVDTVFKDGWFLPESKYIKKIKAEGEQNHFMLYSETDGIGLDEILQYLEATINANIEREKKVELLKIKVNELKEVFKNNSLVKLQSLKFAFEEDLISNLQELKLDPEPEIAHVQEPQGIEPQEPIAKELDLSEEEKELLAEEERAENFKKWKENQTFNKKTKKVAGKIELPPKNREVDLMESDCECGPDEACSKCIHTKDL